MDAWSVVYLIIGATLIGLVVEWLVRQSVDYEWIVVGIGAFLGGLMASEYLGSAGDWGAEVSGLRIFPALLGGIVCGGAVEALSWYLERTRPGKEQPPRAI